MSCLNNLEAFEIQTGGVSFLSRKTSAKNSCKAEMSCMKTWMHRNPHFFVYFKLLYNYFFFLKIHYYATYSSSVCHDVKCYYFAMFLRGCEINRKCIVLWFRSNSVLWICLQALFSGACSCYCCWREFLLPRITCSLVAWLFLGKFLLKCLATVRWQGVSAEEAVLTWFR